VVSESDTAVTLSLIGSGIQHSSAQVHFKQTPLQRVDYCTQDTIFRPSRRSCGGFANAITGIWGSFTQHTCQEYSYYVFLSEDGFRFFGMSMALTSTPAAMSESPLFLVDRRRLLSARMRRKISRRPKLIVVVVVTLFS
jgi:hypothetical protein